MYTDTTSYVQDKQMNLTLNLNTTKNWKKGEQVIAILGWKIFIVI